MFISLIFNNVVLVFFNFILALYFSLRFFQVMRNHYKFVSEIKAFNLIVRESRLSLDFTTAKVSEAIRGIENDISDELKITYDLTKLNSEMTILLKRFSEVEEKVIELVRTNYKMESITISTPADINQEINRVLMKKRKKQLELKKKFQADIKERNLMPDYDCIFSK